MSRPHSHPACKDIIFSEVGLLVLKLLPHKLFAERPELPCLGIALRMRFIDVVVIDLAINKVGAVAVYGI